MKIDHKIFISPFKGGSTSVGVALDMVGIKRWVTDDIWWLKEYSTVKKRESILIAETNKLMEYIGNFENIPNKVSNEIKYLLGDFLIKMFDTYDVADDYPLGHDTIHAFIKKIVFKDRAKFIFVERPMNEYLNSVKLHILNKRYKHIFPHGRKFFCESSLGERITIENYKKWKANYLNLKLLFPKDVLIMDLEDGWEPLSSFLDFEIPNIEFPKLNVSASKEDPCLACVCKHELLYSDQYDSEYCPVCLEWRDELCGEKKCLTCCRRPDKPINP
jgi:hypothetical protein